MHTLRVKMMRKYLQQLVNSICTPGRCGEGTLGVPVYIWGDLKKTKLSFRYSEGKRLGGCGREKV